MRQAYRSARPPLTHSDVDLVRHPGAVSWERDRHRYWAGLGRRRGHNDSKRRGRSQHNVIEKLRGALKVGPFEVVDEEQRPLKEASVAGRSRP